MGLRTVRVVFVRRMLVLVGCCMVYNLVQGFLGRVNRRVLVLLNGRRLLLRVVRTNGTLGYLPIDVCGWLGRLGCRCVLPRYDLNELARAVALAHGLRCCSSMSG